MSSKHIVMISLSEINPNARNTIKSGTGFRTFGILTTILLFVYLPGATIRTENERIGLDTFSLTDFISAEYEYISSLISRI